MHADCVGACGGPDPTTPGTRFVTCPNCSRQTPDGAAFCPACGAPLASLPVLGRGEERRVVTVVFADVVGFTGLAEQRDPEQVKRLIDGCMQRLVADVQLHGGRVDKILGDGILALFGAPIAHEDDAERGVRTGLAMQATVAALAEQTGEAIKLRVGVNTGEVLVGALAAGGDYTAMGDVVNLAARLQAEAPPGAVLVGPATYAGTSSAIRYESAGMVQVRGRSEAVGAWLAFKPLGLPGARWPRRRLPLVGRAEELQALVGAATLAVRRKRPAIITIEGEGGLGKSRLADEVVAAAERDLAVMVTSSRCLPYGESSPLAPLAFGLRPLLGIDIDAVVDADVVTQALAKVDLASALGVDRISGALLQLFGAPSPLDGIDQDSAREEVVRAVASVIAAVARRSPILFRIGDLHWADSSLVEVLERLLASLGAVPFVLFTTSRPEEGVGWPPPRCRHSSLVLRLDPLGDDAARELVEMMIGSAEPGVRRDVIARSGGNPLFLEQLAGLVAETGSPVPSRLPDTLRGMVAARLDTLAPGERNMLDNAAVLGMTGRWAMLEQFGNKVGERPERATLDALASADLLEVDGQTWRFRSPSVRDVAYQMLTKTTRAQRHAGVAAAIEASGSKGRDVADVLAHHWIQAARLVVELGHVPHVPLDTPRRAVTWASHASAAALDRQAFAAAERVAGDALVLLDEWRAIPEPATPRTPRARVREGATSGAVEQGGHGLRLVRAEARIGLRRYDDARADLVRVIAVDEPGAAESTAHAHRLLGLLEYRVGEPAAAERALAEAIARFRSAGDRTGLAQALRTSGLVHILSGRFDEADAVLAEAHDHFAAAGDARGVAWVQQHRAWTSFVDGDLDVADARLDLAEASFAAMGDPNGRSWVLGLRAYVRYQQGRLDEAEALATATVAEADARDDRWAGSMMRVLLAGLRLWAGQVAAAAALAAAAEHGFRAIGDRYGEAQVAGVLVRAKVAGGRQVEAERALDQLASAASTGPQRRWASLVAAGCHAHAGQGERACRAAADALAHGPLPAPARTEVWSAMALGELQRGDVAAALVAAEHALDSDVDAPYALAVSAMTFAAGGLLDQALRNADAALDHPAASYLDRIIAASTVAIVCGVASRARAVAIATGSPATGERSGIADGEPLRTLLEAARTTEDHLARAVAYAAWSLAVPHATGPALLPLGEPASLAGWLQALSAVASGASGASATAAPVTAADVTGAGVAGAESSAEHVGALEG